MWYDRQPYAEAKQAMHENLKCIFKKSTKLRVANPQWKQHTN